MSPLLRLAIIAAATSMSACGPQDGTAVGNGRTAVLDMSGYEDPATGSQAIGLTDGTQVQTLHIVLDRVRLVPSGDCDEEEDDDIDFEGPLVADLAASGVLGGAPSFALATDRFCMLRVGYRRLDLDEAPPGTPPELEDLSIRVTGTRSDGATFVVESRRNDRFELESDEGFTLPVGTQRLFLAYEVGSWITALTLGTLGPGPIEVSESENSDRLDAFEDAVEASARLFHDLNGDGVLAFDERATPLAD